MKPLNQLLRLDGQAAIVTGGAKGIGQAIAYRLAEAGAKVIITDVDAETATAAAADLNARGWQAKAVAADVAEEADVQRVFAACQETFGGLRLLVNNAGIYPPRLISDMAADDLRRVLGVNLVGAFLFMKYAAEAMKQQGGGKIINITSIDALHPSMVGLAHYDASKHGLWGLTKNAALEFAPYNIQINALAPGGVATPGVAAMQAVNPATDPEVSRRQSEAFMAKIPLKRMGEPDEIATATLFLASGMSSYMTGSQLVVDGGALIA